MEIAKIPDFMHTLKWLNAEALMNEWFAGPPNSNPALGTPDTTTIKMAWVLSFKRAKDVYDSIFDGKIWMTGLTGDPRKALKDMCSSSVRTGKPFAFGDLSRSPKDLHHEQITYAVVGGKSTIEKLVFGVESPLDDLYGALGRFSFYVNVEGTAKPALGRAFEFTILKIGVHVRDNYDFNDPPGEDQYLGSWNFSTGEPYKIHMPSSEEVHNSDFRKWRSANKKGGDFYVFSDLVVTTLKTPSVFTL